MKIARELIVNELIEVPQNIKQLLSDSSQQLQKILTTNLVGIYLYGSLAMGGYNPETSDIDILVALKNKLNQDARADIIKVALKISEKATGGGVEMTFVTLNNLKNFQYPTPIELYFSTDLKERFLNGKADASRSTLDNGLAVNITLTKQRGICLFGEPINLVMPDISKEYFLKAAISDFDWSYNNVMKGKDNGKGWVPNYAVLNACRLLAYIKEELIATKTEGGLWGKKNLPKEYKPIILAALKDYRKKDKANLVDLELLKRFMRFVKYTADIFIELKH